MHQHMSIGFQLRTLFQVTITQTEQNCDIDKMKYLFIGMAVIVSVYTIFVEVD